MKPFYYFILILFFSSCNEKNYFNDVKTCINTSYNKGMETQGIDVFDSIKKLENLFISKKLLKSKRKDSYYELINELKYKSDIINKEINKIDLDYTFYSDFNNFSRIDMYDYCHLKTINTEKRAKQFYPIKKIFEKMLIKENGIPSKETLNALFLKTNFNNNTSRLLLLNLIYSHYKGGFIYQLK